jgi:ribosome biogenesis protein SSF1/2
MCDGRVLYHAYVKKTAEEVKTLEQKKVEREKLRKRRRVEQEANVKRKAREKEIKADAERARQGKSKKKSSAVDEFGNVRDVEGEAEDDAKWAAAFEREEKEWQEGDVYDERSGKTKRKRHGD